MNDFSFFEFFLFALAVSPVLTFVGSIKLLYELEYVGNKRGKNEYARKVDRMTRPQAVRFIILLTIWPLAILSDFIPYAVCEIINIKTAFRYVFKSIRDKKE